MPLTSDQTKKFDLVSENYVPGKSTAAAAYSAGDIVQVNDDAGFVFEDVVSGDDYTYVIEAERARALKAGVAIAAGEKIYYDLSAGVVTNVATDNQLIGTCLEAAALGDADVLMYFNARGITLA